LIWSHWLARSSHSSVTSTDKHNYTDLIYLFLIQCYHMFSLSMSAIIR
jgi:hypothetical protein